MKKILSVMLVIIMLPIYCIATDAASPPDVNPQYTNILSFLSSLTFSGTHGGAGCSVDGKTGATKVEATLTVYKQYGNTWVYVGSDSDVTTTEEYAVATVDFDGISGVYYKAVFEVAVTRNGVRETDSKTSIKMCP